jgi:hypothetical protein
MTVQRALLSPVLIIFFIFAVPLLLTAQPASIEVSGDITAHTTWNADTVKVTGDLLVADDVTLTIEIGTYIEFQGWYTLVVEGNSFIDNFGGPTLNCTNGSTALIRNNRIVKTDYDAIYISDSYHVIINNTICNNEWGIDRSFRKGIPNCE